MSGGGRGEAINGGQVHGNRKSDLRKFLKRSNAHPPALWECRLMPINSQSGGDVAATEWMCVIKGGSCRASLRLPSNLSDIFSVFCHFAHLKTNVLFVFFLICEIKEF